MVSRVRRVLHTRAVGHTGTLDPFASGLLVVLLGRATRLARFVEQQAKSYLATARLGARSTTDDLTGTLVGGKAEGREGGISDRAAEPPSRRAVEAALAGFLGSQTQRPPAFSARRIDGERSYRLARRGIAVELPGSPVVVEAIELVEYAYPEVVFRTTVSAGTYVRALARDLGEVLGIGAYLVALRRERIGALELEQAVPLAAIERNTPVLPPLSVLVHLARIVLSVDQAKALSYGKTVSVSGWAGAEPVAGQPIAALGPDERLLAVGRVDAGMFHPEVVLEPAGG